MTAPLRFLLFQVRNPDDPMREHEVESFSRSLRCKRNHIDVFDLIGGVPSARQFDAVDVVLLGGSGDYSVAKGGPWLPEALEAMRQLHETSKPTFASCWGFQAMARAMGGEVVTDRDRAEVGTRWMEMTPEGKRDPVFGPLGDRFQVQIGHEDIVTKLPEGATLLASSDRVQNEAFRFDGKPIYCTQFHPELRREDFVERCHAYPEYVDRIAGLPLDEFIETVQETPQAHRLIRRFVDHVLA